MSIYEGCQPRQEVLVAELSDALFAANFGDVVAGKAPPVYGDASTFFRNTYPTRQLKETVSHIFSRLANPNEAGAVVRLSTGFGGGKTHTLIALWHLAHHLHDFNPDVVKLLPAAGRPEGVRVVGIDAEKAGTDVFDRHNGIVVRSLQGELAWQLQGAQGLQLLADQDDPLKQIDEALLERLLPEEPTLILLDELVVYLSLLEHRAQNSVLALLNRLASIASRRPQLVLVVTDPADQRVYSQQAGQIDEALREAATRLDELLSRRATDVDPIGVESAQIITTRLFEGVDPQEAERVSAEYHRLYTRVLQENPNLLPSSVATQDYAQRIRQCYPFHPRLLETAEGRLAALPDFQRSRGVLRLFARIVRDLWERRELVDLITAGEVNWSSPRLRDDLIQRINRQQFEAVVRADIEQHAAELDGGTRGIHTRVASALLLESLAMDAHSGLDMPDLTLAVLRPEEAGHEPREAMERLAGVCWHTYPFAGGAGWQFRVEPNVNRMIEERIAGVPLEDARARVMAQVQEKYQGSLFHLVAWPRQPRDVSDSARLQLVLCESTSLAEQVCKLADDGTSPLPRRFINAIAALAPTPEKFNEAIAHARRLIAGEQVQEEYRRTEKERATREQMERILPTLRKRFQVASIRAFDTVVLASGVVGRIDAAYQVGEESIQRFMGQQELKKFLQDKGQLYERTDALDPERLLELLAGATPLPDNPEVYTARAVHERLLSAPELRLIPDESFVRSTLQKALQEGKIVLRLEDGSAYDHRGMVKEGVLREGTPPYSLPMNDTVLITRAEGAVAKQWLTVRQPEQEETTPSEPFTLPTSTPSKVYSLEEAIRRLDDPHTEVERILLSIIHPEQEDVLLRAIQVLGPNRLQMSVQLSGRTGDGVTVNFMAKGVPSFQHPTRPHEVAKRLYRALPDGVEKYELVVEMQFTDAAEELRQKLLRLQEMLGEGIGFTAHFSAREAST